MEKLKGIKYVFPLTFLLLAALLTAACSKQQEAPDKRLRIVTTIFPLYDYVRNIGGDYVTVQLLLPPGVEAHSFEPKPEELLRVSRADLFVFTNREMEPWADKLLSAVQGDRKPLQVEAGARAVYLSAADSHGHGEHGHGADRRDARDPHIWLNIANARLMVDSIAEAMSARLPAGSDAFRANAAAYKKRLDALEIRFQDGLSSCRTREFLHGGHYAFAYLADRYKLTYVSAYGITADSEPSPRRMMELVNSVREHKLKYIFFEELLAPRIAETISRETGAALLKLHGIHNLTRDELESGASYLGLMEQNLANLRKGLECR